MLQVESELVEAEFKHASAFVTLFKAGGAPLSALRVHLLHAEAGNDFTRAKSLIHEWRRFCPCGTLCWFSGILLIVQVALVGIFWQCGNIHKRFLC